MDDLGALSQALEEACKPSGGGTEGLFVLVEPYLKSPERTVRSASCAALDDMLNDPTLSVEARRERQTFAFEATSMVYIPILLRNLPDAPTPVEHLLHTISDIANAKEVMLVLGMCLEELQLKIEGVDVSDDDETGDDQAEGEENEEGDMDSTLLSLQLGILLSCYARAIPRLSITKSTPTLLALLDSLSPLLPALAPDLDAPSALTVLRGVTQLVVAAWQWAQTKRDGDGEPKTLLRKLLSQGVALLCPQLGTVMLDQWFLLHFPKFQPVHPELQASTSAYGAQKAAMDGVMDAFLSLNTGPEELLDAVLYPSSIDFHAALAALQVVAHLVSRSKADTDQVLPARMMTRSVLHDSMPVLTAALSSSGITAGLVWTWELVRRAAEGHVDVDYDSTSMILEHLTSLAERPTGPTTQLALVKLIGAIVAAVPGPEDQIKLFKQLIDPASPFFRARLESLRLLREQVSSSSQMPIPEQQRRSSLLCTQFKAVLAPIIFDVTCVSDMWEHDESAETFRPAWYTECLQLFWLVLQLDKEEDKTGLRDRTYLDNLRVEWLGPLKEKLEAAKADMDGDDLETAFMLDRWDDALRRAESALTELRK